MSILNLKKQYFFYKEYHKNPCNKFIHYICIPILVYSVFLFLNYIPYHYKFEYLENYTLNDITFNLIDNNSTFCQTTLDNIFLVNSTYIIYFLYIFYYLLLDILTGILCIPFYGIICIMSVYSVYNFYNRSWILGIMLQIFSWILQFMGHRFCEKNKPALCNGIIKTILIAPFFVIFDLLHICCCYKKRKLIKSDSLTELLS